MNTPLSQLENVGPVTAGALERAGFKTVDDIRGVKQEEFVSRVSAAVGRIAADGAQAEHPRWDKLITRCINVYERILSAEAQPIVPEEVLCPITWDWLRDPVVAPSGHTFERCAITRWIQEAPREKKGVTGQSHLIYRT